MPAHHNKTPWSHSTMHISHCSSHSTWVQVSKTAQHGLALLMLRMCQQGCMVRILGHWQQCAIPPAGTVHL